MPLLLSHCVKSPFLDNLTNIPLVQSSGRVFFFKISVISVIEYILGAFFFFKILCWVFLVDF